MNENNLNITTLHFIWTKTHQIDVLLGLLPKMGLLDNVADVKLDDVTKAATNVKLEDVSVEKIKSVATDKAKKVAGDKANQLALEQLSQLPIYKYIQAMVAVLIISILINLGLGGYVIKGKYA